MNTAGVPSQLHQWPKRVLCNTFIVAETWMREVWGKGRECCFVGSAGRNCRIWHPQREKERGGLLTLSPAVGQQEDAAGQNWIKLYVPDLHSAPCPVFGLHLSGIPTQKWLWNRLLSISVSFRVRHRKGCKVFSSAGCFQVNGGVGGTALCVCVFFNFTDRKSMTQLMSHKSPNILWSIIQWAPNSERRRIFFGGGLSHKCLRNFQAIFFFSLSGDKCKCIYHTAQIIICVRRSWKLLSHIWHVN